MDFVKYIPYALFILAGLAVGILLTQALSLLFRKRRRTTAADAGGAGAAAGASVFPPVPVGEAIAAESPSPAPNLEPGPAPEPERTVVADESPAPVPVPESEKPARLFTLSREDVFDHAEDMNNDRVRFPVPANIKEKTHAKLPDYLRCGERCFGLMYERDDLVFSFILRMDAELAKTVSERHPIKRSKFPGGDNWYKLVIDASYKSKRGVYKLLDECYEYVWRKYYEGKDADADAPEARIEQAQIEADAARNAGLSDEDAVAAEKAYRAALAKYKAEHFSDFKITRKEIIADTRAARLKGVAAAERDDRPYLPASLNCKGRTYAMLYEKDGAVSMTVRISDAYAETLAETHPEVRRARWPKVRNWYIVPVDGAFPGKDAVYEVLNSGITFVSADAPASVGVPHPAAKPVGTRKPAVETAEPLAAKSAPSPSKPAPAAARSKSARSSPVKKLDRDAIKRAIAEHAAAKQQSWRE
ncbi:hypothetical protein FACS1894211_08570 [Clostridia bacterium]|nr:hypothetical protein FACS1894211_08570 [Clostridia bacterium]